jgi:hypothetical protein
MKSDMGLYLVYVLSAISIASFAYAAYNGFLGEYQESVFLFGIGFIVLAQVMFAYRIFRYPDSWKQEDLLEEGPAMGAE